MAKPKMFTDLGDGIYALMQKSRDVRTLEGVTGAMEARSGETHSSIVRLDAQYDVVVPDKSREYP